MPQLPKMISTQTLNKVKAYAREKMPKASQHDFGHLERLEKNALEILAKLDVNKRKKVRKNTLLIACYLHDLTYTVKLPAWYAYLFEGLIAKKLATKLLSDLGVGRWDTRRIAKAVASHPHSFPFRRLHRTGSLYTQILQDADTLDFFAWARIASFGHRRLTSRLIDKLAREPHIFNVFFNLSEAFEIFLADRITFHFAEAGDKKETPTLLLPGYADTVTHFTPLFNRLKDNQHLIVLDMPYLHYRGTWQVPDVGSYIHSFLERQNLPKVHLVGFSFDGLVAVDFAYRYPHKIASLTLLNSLPVLVPTAGKRMVVKFLKPLLTNHLVTWFIAQVVTNKIIRIIFHSPKTARLTLQRMRRFHHSTYGSLISGLDKDYTRKFNRLQTTKRIILFADDRVVNVRKYHKVIATLDTPVTNLPQGGHGDGEHFWEEVVKNLF